MAPNILGISTISNCSILGSFYTSVASTSNQLLFHNKSSLNQPSLASALPSSAKPNSNVSAIGLKFPSGSVFKRRQHRIHCWTGSESGIEENDGITPAPLERPAYVPKGDGRENVFFGPSDKDEDGSEEEKSVPRWVDWEDVILKDIIPLKGLARTILHSDWYTSGERLSPEHETIILEKLLPYHPELEEKIGSGVDFITLWKGIQITSPWEPHDCINRPRSKQGGSAKRWQDICSLLSQITQRAHGEVFNTYADWELAEEIARSLRRFSQISTAERADNCGHREIHSELYDKLEGRSTGLHSRRK